MPRRGCNACYGYGAKNKPGEVPRPVGGGGHHHHPERALHDGAETKSVIAKLLNAFQVAGVDKADCIKALNVDMDDYEDALVSVCAKKVKAEYIVTQNTKNFGNSPVPTIKPADFLKVGMD